MPCPLPGNGALSPAKRVGDACVAPTGIAPGGSEQFAAFCAGGMDPSSAPAGVPSSVGRERADEQAKGNTVTLTGGSYGDVAGGPGTGKAGAGRHEAGGQAPRAPGKNLDDGVIGFSQCCWKTKRFSFLKGKQLYNYLLNISLLMKPRAGCAHFPCGGTVDSENERCYEYLSIARSSVGIENKPRIVWQVAGPKGKESKWAKVSNVFYNHTTRGQLIPLAQDRALRVGWFAMCFAGRKQQGQVRMMSPATTFAARRLRMKRLRLAPCPASCPPSCPALS
jgi:hypothetical protein